MDQRQVFAKSLIGKDKVHKSLAGSVAPKNPLETKVSKAEVKTEVKTAPKKSDEELKKIKEARLLEAHRRLDQLKSKKRSAQKASTPAPKASQPAPKAAQPVPKQVVQPAPKQAQPAPVPAKVALKK